MQARDTSEDDRFCYDQAALISDILSDSSAVKSPATQYMLTASSASALRQEGTIPPVSQGGETTEPSGAVAASLSVLSAIIAMLSLLLF